MQGGAGLPAYEAIGSLGQDFGQPRHAPARQVVGVRHPANREPGGAFARLGWHDGGFVSLAGESLRIQRGTLRIAQLLGPIGKARFVHKMEIDRVLATICLY